MFSQSSVSHIVPRTPVGEGGDAMLKETCATLGNSYGYALSIGKDLISIGWGLEIYPISVKGALQKVIEKHSARAFTPKFQDATVNRTQSFEFFPSVILQLISNLTEGI